MTAGGLASQLTGCLAISMVIGLIGTGCGKKDDDVSSTVQTRDGLVQKPATAIQLEEAFKSADEATKQDVTDAASAMATKDYEKAAAALMAAGASPKLTQDQGLALRKSMRDFQFDLSKAASQGDPRAKAAIRLLRAGSGH